MPNPNSVHPLLEAGYPRNCGERRPPRRAHGICMGQLGSCRLDQRFLYGISALTCLAATFNPELAFKYGNAIGQEARYREKDVILGPGVNIYRTPLSGRNFEYMGEDPYLSSRMVVPYVKGMQQNGVAACLKHFALNNQEKDRDKINVEVSDRALYEIYLPAFQGGCTGRWSMDCDGFIQQVPRPVLQPQRPAHQPNPKKGLGLRTGL